MIATTVARVRPLALSAWVLALVSTTPLAQEETERVLPPLPESVLPEGAGDPMEEMRKLFLQVETNLKRIDVMLNDAGAGDIPLGEVADSGLDDLLRRTQSNSKDVVRDIDRILELAQQMNGKSGSISPNPQPGDGQSPLDQPRDGSPQGRERTPEQPGQKDGQNQPQPQDGDRPDGNQGNDDPGQNRPGTPQDRPGGDAVPVDPDAEEWGMLPSRTRQIFRNEGSDDVPVQYRNWIDSYYRRLNKSER